MLHLTACKLCETILWLFASFGGFALMGSQGPPQPLSYSPASKGEGENKVCRKEKGSRLEVRMIPSKQKEWGKQTNKQAKAMQKQKG